MSQEVKRNRTWSFCTSPSQSFTGRRGYSLLEVLLALALSVVVFSAIAMAIRIHLVALTKQQAMIERKQIARSVMTMVANDLRAGIQYKATDYSGLENLIASQQLTAGSMVPAEAEEEAAEAEPEESEVYDEELVSFRPTLIGTDNVLMMDISRLPRIDQYNPLIASSNAIAHSPSDVKSVGYFVSNAMPLIDEAIDFESAAPGGLYRREIDRAYAAYVEDFGLVDQPDPQTKLIASEVAQIAFRYWDGESWQESWDSVENGGFPPAIEITLVIDPARTSDANTTYAFAGFDVQTMEMYSQVVHLPVADPPPAEE